MPLNTRSPRSSKIKTALLISAFCIVVPILLYTHNLVEQLQKKEREVAGLYARSLEYLANEANQSSDYSFVFDEIIRAIDFPIIQTDSTDLEIRAYRNVPIDSTLMGEEKNQLLREWVTRMDILNKPIMVTYQDSIVLSKVHYGESLLITRLRWIPYIELCIGGIFVLIGYLSFSYIKKNEQSNIWVGMARETAHQLGTPLSSMMGWIEMLKLHAGTDSKMGDTVHEMENDLQRLNKIAERFSKIGSKPDLREEHLDDVVQGVIQYFNKRIPQMGKRVEISVECEGTIAARINRELFEWVLENLIKNGLDAMEDGKGRITLRISRVGRNAIIDVSDTGKGIDSTFRKDIFRPGFSTKKRGWGLGLSLSKRIIESYHRGKLFVKESRLGIGTTFRIKVQA
jgi:hypothetical protein